LGRIRRRQFLIGAGGLLAAGEHDAVLQILERWYGAVRQDGTLPAIFFSPGADPAAGDGQPACPAIATLRGTIVDLGELGPGTWTLVAHGDLAPIQVTID